MYSSISAAFVLLTPVVLLRWRVVIAEHELLLVFLRVRRIHRCIDFAELVLAHRR